MRFHVLTDPEEFLKRTTVLLEDRARHNLIVILASDAARAPEFFADVGMFIVGDKSGAVAAALITPPNNLVLGAVSTEAAMDTLIAGLRNHGVPIPGAVGIRPSIDQFVAAWRAATGDLASLEIAHGVFLLDTVHAVPQTDGAARLAVEDDYDTVLAWSMAFMEEALPGDPVDPDGYSARVRGYLDESVANGVWLWESGGEPVAMSSHSGPDGTVVRIRNVYTPPRLRGNGYATALVAHQSQWALDVGYRNCTLFTDLSNPTSNAIYQRIGYRQIAESAQYRFSVRRSQPS